MEDEIVRITIPKLEELIQELAELHGVETADKVRTLLKKPFEPPQEFEKFLREIFATMVTAAQAQTAAPAAQSQPDSNASNQV